MEVITSKTNALVKHIKKLGDKKYRAEKGQYLAEGVRWVLDARARHAEQLCTVVRRESFAFEGADAVLRDDVFDGLACTENSQGVLAVMRMPPSCAPAGDRVLLLDRIRDPGNLGTILRTACAAGFCDVVLRDCVDAFNPKVIRASMTGVLDLRLCAFESVQALKNGGYTLVGTALEGANLFESSVCAEKICLVVGNEAEGIDKSILSACDSVLTIPMQNHIDSLNAAVAAGIAMYALQTRGKSRF